SRQGIDRDRAPGVQSGLGGQHRKRRLARTDVPDQPYPASFVQACIYVAHIAAYRGDDWLGHFRNRWAVERNALVALGQARLEACGPAFGDMPCTATAVGGCVGGLVYHEAAAVA